MPLLKTSLNGSYAPFTQKPKHILNLFRQKRFKFVFYKETAKPMLDDFKFSTLNEQISDYLDLIFIQLILKI